MKALPRPATSAAVSRPPSSPTRCGAPAASPSASAMWRSCWPSAGCSSPPRPSGGGPARLARPTRTSAAAADRARATRGTWMRSSLRATACRTIPGVPSLGTVPYSTAWCSPAALPRPRGGSSARCSRGSGTPRASSSPTSARVLARPSAPARPVWSIGDTRGRTTGPRTPTSRRASARGGGAGARRRATPSASSPRMGRSPATAARAATA